MANKLLNMINYYKENKHRMRAVLAIACLLSTCPAAVKAQDDDSNLTATILHQDSLFWQGYNSCDVQKMQPFFTEDVEFYHDKGGVTLGLTNLIASFKNGPCKSPDSFRLRREEVKGSIRVFPLHKAGTIYGAILSGEHEFYILQRGKHERLDGLAKFTHLWLLKDGVWKMARCLSYDHGPAPFVQTKTEISLTAGVLQSYAGKYKGVKTGLIEARVDSGRLILLIGDHRFNLYPAKENSFFSKERDLEFEFVKEGKNPMKMIVRENGDLAEELIRQE